MLKKEHILRHESGVGDLNVFPQLAPIPHPSYRMSVLLYQVRC